MAKYAQNTTTGHTCPWGSADDTCPKKMEQFWVRPDQLMKLIRLNIFPILICCNLLPRQVSKLYDMDET
jgi:hypothetical protein